MKEGMAARRGRAGAVTIKDLLSYRVHRLSSILSRSAAVRYRKEFDVSLGEWRALALLGAFAPMSLNQLAREADLDKGQMSRVISGLVDRGLVLREPGLRRDRSSLSLTPAGEKIYAGLIAAAAERNTAFLACLTAEELAAMESAISKLSALGRALGGAASAAPPPGKRKAATQR